VQQDQELGGGLLLGQPFDGQTHAPIVAALVATTGFRAVR
jgi:hypothetical protein